MIPTIDHPVLCTSLAQSKALQEAGIDHWKEIFFVENEDFYKKLLNRMTKKIGFIQLDNPVEIKSRIYKDRDPIIINHVDYVEGINVCAFRNYRDKIESLNCYDTMSIVNVGRELVRTLLNKKVKLQ